MFIMLALPPETPAIAAKHCGPPTRALKGIAPGSGAYLLVRGTRAALREIPGAVVVVEDDAPTFLNRLPPGLRFSPWNLRLFSGRENPAFPSTPPPPAWMDPNVTISGGNVVHRVFTFGGGNF